MVNEQMLRNNVDIVGRYIEIQNTRSHRGATRNEIGVNLEMNWEAIDRALDRLEEMGQLQYYSDGRSTFYFVRR